MDRRQEAGAEGKGPFAQARESTPHGNARAAEDMTEDEKRREVEQAQANKHAAEKEKRGDTLGSVADINSAMTSRD